MRTRTSCKLSTALLIVSMLTLLCDCATVSRPDGTKTRAYYPMRVEAATGNAFPDPHFTERLFTTVEKWGPEKAAAIAQQVPKEQ